VSLVAVSLDHGPRCKFCTHPKRAEIDALICAQRNGEFNRDELLIRLAALEVKNPTVDNIKSHCGTEKKPAHVKFIPEEELDEAKEFMAAETEKLKSGQFEPVDPDQLLQLQLKAYEQWLAAKIAAGEEVHLTHDHAIKIVAEMTKRRHNQAQQEILGALTGGIAKALGGEVLKQLPAADEPEVVDVDATEVDGEG